MNVAALRAAIEARREPETNEPRHAQQRAWNRAIDQCLEEVDRWAAAQPGLDARLTEFAEDVVRQFGYWHDGVGGFTAGGLSTLEDAFAILGWEEPHVDEHARCDEPGCLKQSNCGTPTLAGYRRTCGDHMPKAANAEYNAARAAWFASHPGTTYADWLEVTRA